MKYLKLAMLTVLATFAGLLQAQNNVLRVDSVETPAGKNVTLPIVLENTSDITGVQFDISVPYQLAADEETGQLTVTLSKTRANSHTVAATARGTTSEYCYPQGMDKSGQWMTYYMYRIIVYSQDNALILDNQGTLLSLQLTTDGTLGNGAVLPVHLNNVTLSDRDLQNVLTDAKDAAIVIKEIPRPDLTPLSVTFTEKTVNPGGTLNVAWKVKNIGQVATEGGWSEEVALINLGGTKSKVLSTTRFSGTLAANSEVSRQAELALPELLGIDGVAKVQVTVIPNDDAGEHPSLRDNNVAASESNISVGKKLVLELSPTTVSENQTWQRITAKLSRSGSWSNTQSFTISRTNDAGEASQDTRLTIPELVTISEGQSAVLFYITVNDNDVLDADTAVVLTVNSVSTSNPYEPVTGRVVIVDNEQPALTVTLSKTEVAEGVDTELTLTITTQRAPKEDLTVTLTSENNKRFAVPSSVVIPAGQKSVQVAVRIVNDDTPNGTLTNQFTVSAPNHVKGTALVMISDDDLPVLSLTLTPTQVQESDGPVSVAGVLKRITNKDKKVTIRLTDDADGKLYFGNRTLEMAKGVEEIHFNFGPADNQDVDGDRTYTITAAVWLSSCSCSAAGEAAGHVSAQLSVLDDDGPALRLTAKQGTVKEGGTTTLTIERNNATDKPLTVTLSSDYDDQLEYNHEVTIPAGSKTVDVVVRSLPNNVTDDSHTVIFTVQSGDYAKGTCWVMITDQTLPDAIISIQATPAEAVVGDDITVTVTVTNDGAAPLPSNTQVKIYEKGHKDALATLPIDENLAIGAVKTIEKVLTLSKTVGVHQLYAVVNETNTVKELSVANNTSEIFEVSLLSPFQATIQTDRDRYNLDDNVNFTGQLSGRDYANAPIDLYVISDGIRQSQRITTDGEGKFAYSWLVNTSLAGHVVAGVCYPDEGATTAMTTFEVFTLRRTTTGYIKNNLTVGEAFEAAVELQNPGQTALTGVKVEVVSKPEGYIVESSLPATIAAGAKPLLTYTLTSTIPGSGKDWEVVNLLVTSAEGAKLPIAIYNFSQMAQANLVLTNPRITTTMTKGQTREYPVQIVNNGKGNTGELTLALPDWMGCAQGKTLAGINKGDTATVVLLFKPTADMQLNVPVTGTIGFNVQYGNGTYANYSITPVSDQKGTLVVEVADEYTYYTEEKPHVKDAQVVLRNSVTNALVTQGVTGDDGRCTFPDLPEGYYKLSVTADNHDSYSNNIIVDPGVTTTKVVNLSIEAIKVTWAVEETEVEDVYDIVTTVTYETNVPVPVVDLIVPSRIPADSLAEGESLVFYAIATNKGLINAQDVSFRLPDVTDVYQWEPLAESTGLTLAPQQSYILPVKVTRIPETQHAMRRAAGGGPCHDQAGVDYSWQCGYDRKWHSVEKPITFKVCEGTAAAGGGGGGGVGGGLGNPGGAGGGGYGWSSYGEKVTIVNECDPCAMSFLNTAVNCVIDIFTPYGCAKGLVQCVASLFDGKWGFWDIANKSFDCGLTIAGCLVKETVGKVLAVLSCVKNFLVDTVVTCAKTGTSSGAPRRATVNMETLETEYTSFGYINETLRSGYLLSKQWDATLGIVHEIMGDSLWFDVTGEEMEKVLDVVGVTPDNELVADNLRHLKPEGVTNEVFDSFIERVANTRRYALDQTEPANDNRVHAEVLKQAVDSFYEAENWAMEHRNTTVDEYWNSSQAKVIERLNEPRNSVCSTITLQIKQTMTMTRQAFRGTLTVFNGSETEAMTDMKLNLVVSDKNNNVATTHEFQINAESLKNLEGEVSLTSGWTLQPNTEGTATILFIPTKYAAPTEPVEWSFGGTLSYTDPFTGLVMTRELFPVTLTVKPSPELDLTYFMQRDVYGDDPLTKDIVEPMEDAEFALLINNKGYGDATNVRMTTQQPEITENEKGLAIEFEIVSSQVNGGPAALSFGQTIANDLGTIPAHSQTYAQWWLQSTLLGHFSTYHVEATHVTSYGNEDLSLLDNVTIHELIRGFTPPADSENTPKRAFLVNDVEDADDMPDQIYFTDATQTDVSIAQYATATKKSTTEYELFVLPDHAGWTYASLLDPTAGRQKLLKVVRLSDGKELPLDNVWQTNRTLRDGMEWLYDHRLHFVGEVSATGGTYTLIYEERPDVELDVTITGPVYEEEFTTEKLVTNDVNEVTVTFNKPIVPETFTADDLTLNVQGKQQDLSTVPIAAKNNSTMEYTLDFTEFNKTQPNGYYVLTVQTAGITDNEGFQGIFGRKIDWVLFRGGLIQLKTSVFPELSGSVNLQMVEPAGSPRRKAPAASTDAPAYGSTFQLEATPKPGYEFTGWTIDDQVVETDPIYRMTANADIDIVANFKKQQIKLTVNATEGGTLRGTGTGVYDYDTEAVIIAVPDEEFVLDGWTVNGEMVTTDTDTLRMKVTAATEVEARFRRDIFTEVLDMARGWNWISTFLRENQPLGDMARYVSRIVSQDDELVFDPVNGMTGGIENFISGKAYKVETATRFSQSMRGHLYDTKATPVTLKTGWNWLAYPYYAERTLDSTLPNVSEGDYITSQAGFAQFTDGAWEGTLTMLTPGQGYLYKSADNKTLVFNFDDDSASSAQMAPKMANNTYNSADVDIYRYPNTMNVVAHILRDGTESLGGEYSIYALAGNELRGVSQYVGTHHYLTVHGIGSEPLVFIVENVASGDSYEVNETLNFADDVVGSRKNPFVFTIGDITGITLVEGNDGPMTVYSLQGVLISRDATLKSLRRLPRGVYIVNGKKCYIK